MPPTVFLIAATLTTDLLAGLNLGTAIARRGTGMLVDALLSTVALAYV